MSATALPADFTTCHKLTDGRRASRARINGVWCWAVTPPHVGSDYPRQFVSDSAIAALVEAARGA